MGIIVTYNNKCRLFTSSNISRANSADLEPSKGLLTFESSSSFEQKLGILQIDIFKRSKNCASEKWRTKYDHFKIGPLWHHKSKWVECMLAKFECNALGSCKSVAWVMQHDGIGRIGIWCCGKWINALWLISNRRIFSQGAISSLPKHQIHFHINGVSHLFFWFSVTKS